jgi:5'-3' exonuclease
MPPGIKHLSKVLKDQSSRVALSIVNVDNRLYAVDMSIVLVKALCTTKASDQFYQVPEVPVTAILHHLEKFKNTLDGAKIPFIAVFDGCRHPLKGKTTEKRKRTLDAKKTKLEELIAGGDPQSYAEIQKLRKQTTFIREDIIALARDWCIETGVPYICAPFEADWQLSLMC